MRTITLHLDEATYRLFEDFADQDNRNVPNMIETITKKHLLECVFLDADEMAALTKDRGLLSDLKKGGEDAHNKKGRIA